MYTLRLACRQKGTLSISATPAYSEFFGLGDAFDAQWINNRLVISKVANGKYRAKVPTSYDLPGYIRQLEFNPSGFSLPGFCVAEAQFDALGRNVISWARPPIWELTWPVRAAFTTDITYALDQRLDSARRRGVPLTNVLSRVPQWARDIVDWDIYKSIIIEEWEKAQVV